MLKYSIEYNALLCVYLYCVYCIFSWIQIKVNNFTVFFFKELLVNLMGGSSFKLPRSYYLHSALFVIFFVYAMHARSIFNITWQINEAGKCTEEEIPLDYLEINKCLNSSILEEKKHITRFLNGIRNGPVELFGWLLKKIY